MTPTDHNHVPFSEFTTGPVTTRGDDFPGRFTVATSSWEEDLAAYDAEQGANLQAGSHLKPAPQGPRLVLMDGCALSMEQVVAMLAAVGVGVEK